MAKATATRRLVTAIKKGNVAGAAAAIEEGVDYSTLVSQIPPLGWAVHENQPEIAKLMLEAGCPADTPDDNGATPLQSCSTVRSEFLSDDDAVTMARLLIEHRANLMACDRNHEHAPLAMARRRGKEKLAQLLIEHGAKAFCAIVTMQDEQGQPIAGEFYYGIPDGDYPVAQADDTGRLELQNVFPGPLLIGYEGDEQVVTVNEDESVTPNRLTWTTS